MTEHLKGCLFLLVLFAVPAVAADTPHPTPWNVIAGSDAIVAATITDVIEDPAPASDSRVADYRSGKLEVVVQKVFKGHPPVKLRTDYFAFTDWSPELLTTIRALRGKTAILFMLQSVDPMHHAPWFSLPGQFGAAAVTFDSDAVEQQVRDELTREPLQVSETAAYLADLDGGVVEPQVQAAIESMASEHEARRNAGVEQLRALRCKAVPYVIKHMDDRRPFQGILRGPSSWEAFAQYQPKQMTDALSMVLGSITNFVVRPDREEYQVDDTERRKIIDSWLLYLAHTRLHEADSPSQLPNTCR